ncbi:hypothetical protein KCP69_04530 [Salmonella enterica subsp. enterica]|nr:hypothetical protein KCP69_04530 [Salmonella enterica subsp. enterica]
MSVAPPMARCLLARRRGGNIAVPHRRAHGRMGRQPRARKGVSALMALEAGSDPSARATAYGKRSLLILPATGRYYRSRRRGLPADGKLAPVSPL